MPNAGKLLAMNEIILDASALLAVLNREPGSEKLTPELMSRAVCSTVNIAEVHSKLVKDGVPYDEAWRATMGLIHEAVQFSLEHARLAGSLTSKTRSLGLSLADRACLALAISLDRPVYTTDRSWKNLQVGAKIKLLR